MRINAVDREDKPLRGVKFHPGLLQKDGRRTAVNSGSQIFVATTGPDGVATFKWLPVNDLPITFWGILGGYSNCRVDMNGRKTGTVIVRMSRTEAIRGRILRPDGSPATGVEVLAVGSGKGPYSGVGRAASTADGSYEMAVTAGETYAIYVDDADWAALTHLDEFVGEGQPAD